MAVIVVAFEATVADGPSRMTLGARGVSSRCKTTGMPFRAVRLRNPSIRFRIEREELIAEDGRLRGRTESVALGAA